MGFQSCVPGLCTLKKSAGLPYPVKKVCSIFYKCPLEHCTVFSNDLLDVQRIGNMGTSFFTPLWQIECTSLVIATLKETTISSVGFSSCVPRLRALKKNANLPYPLKIVCSFFYKCPFEHHTAFSNYLLDVQRAGNMGTSFFTPLWGKSDARHQ